MIRFEYYDRATRDNLPRRRSAGAEVGAAKVEIAAGFATSTGSSAISPTWSASSRSPTSR